MPRRSGAWGGYQSPGGAELLFGSLFGIFFGNFAGLANPLLWLSWIFFGVRNRKAAKFVSLAAALLSLQTFQLLVQPYYFDEGGVVRGFLTAPHVGWFLWLASMLLITAASWNPD